MHFSRSVLPGAQIKSNMKQDEITEQLFGLNDLNQNFTNLANDPLILLCKDDIYEQSFGTEVDGFSIKFCNKTTLVQTDVGLCVASDSTISYEEEKLVRNSQQQSVSNDLRNVEHLMVLSVSKIGNLHTYEVLIK